ncbi:MAG: Rieske 2Fe-2S domain-containing protein [Melioribacteraceae bacterium]|jgi:cytochrome b6-f complex iron-sulfur subunit|nr:Rieske 2Fe-2S domain-containing protein [Melioribacteraceae bacterium]
MNNNKKISRRNLFKQLALSFSIPTVFLWYFGTKRKVTTAKKTKVIIPNNLTNGITFLDNAIVKKDGENLTVFSPKCTHLGCKINSTADNKLVCPCHGSKFNFDGVPQNGPATTPLTKLKIETDKSTDEMVVYV